MFPDTPIPPQPIVTRWGTWIEAAIYLAEHFEKIESFLNELNPDDAKSIAKAQAAIKDSNIKSELAFIKCHFACISAAITKLETNGVRLGDAIRTFTSVRMSLQAIPKRKGFLQKFDYVHNKNYGLKTLEKIARILEDGVCDQTDEYIDGLNPLELEAFKYAPVTSCDVERSFSAYKRVLEDCRRSFVFENLIKHVVIHCNKFN